MTGSTHDFPHIRRSEHGFTIIELLISLSIMLGVTGAIFTLVNPGQSTFRVQPEVADMQQRLRVASDVLVRHLMMAGGGMYVGDGRGPLIQFFAPVMPYRIGSQSPDPASGTYFRDDAVSMVFVPNTPAQTSTLGPITSPTMTVGVASQPGCPTGDPLCGFAAGQTVLVFDETGMFDAFQVTGVQAAALELQKMGTTLSAPYAAGAYITRVEHHTYYADPATRQLLHYDGWTTDLPVVDDVVGLQFRYFGDPTPPAMPRPAPGVANCLFDAAGTPTLGQLAGNGSLVELTEAMLTDGPWCGGNNQFDADLYRVRKIRVDVRVQVAALDLRGADPALFRQPGPATQGSRMVPDYEMSVDVSPRNLNLAR